jgi:hypothetical protein
VLFFALSNLSVLAQKDFGPYVHRNDELAKKELRKFTGTAFAEGIQTCRLSYNFIRLLG